MGFDPGTGNYASTYSPFFNPASIPVRGDKQETRRKTVSFQADVVASLSLRQREFSNGGGISDFPPYKLWSRSFR